MTIRTSRTSENATIHINYDKCNNCGTCVVVCKDFSLHMVEGKLQINNNPLFGCIGCGHCVAVCTHDAITISGRTVDPGDFEPLVKQTADYTSLHTLLLNRRSIRDFKDKPVPSEIINKILTTASTAPMGIPPSDVGVLVIEGKEKNRQFSFDFIDMLSIMQYMVNPIALKIMRLFMSRQNHSMMTDFVKPLVDFMIKSKKDGQNYLLYDAPLALMFYGKMSDPADCFIAATYATLAAESLGLGSCMIGSIGPFLKNTGTSFKKKYGLPLNMNESIVVVIGYPVYRFHKTIKRSFAEVNYI
jgi:ferredoxin